MTTTATGRWRISVGFLCDIGLRRESNEDAQSLYLPYMGEASHAAVDGLFAVADGMGGHAAGDVASRVAVEAAERAFAVPETAVPEELSDLPRQIERLLQGINRDLIELAETRHLARGVGAAMTLAVLRGRTLYLGHVGDTRCYRLRRGRLDQLTEDHSWVAEQRRVGLLTPEEEASHPDRNLLTQCLGIDRELHVFVREEPVEQGDRYLLCSDGLHGPVCDEMLRQVLQEETDPQAAARRLIDFANDAGGPDNITAVLVYVERPPADTPTAPIPGSARLLGDASRDRAKARASGTLARGLVLSGILTLIIAVGLGAWLYFGSGRAVPRPREGTLTLPQRPGDRSTAALRTDSLGRPLSYSGSPALVTPHR